MLTRRYLIIAIMLAITMPAMADWVTTNIAVGSYPLAFAVNPVTNKIYVANSGSNNVTVIDGATNNTTPVGVGSGPYAVAVNPVTNKIYVANSQSDNVTVIDGVTNNTTNVNVGTSPYAVAVNPVTNKIYVANFYSNNVTVIDGTTNNTTNVNVSTQPYAVAVNPVTNKIYVANSESNSVTVIDGATNNTTPVGVGSGPHAVAVNPVTNKIYVANSFSDNATVIDGVTNNTTNVNVGTRPYAVTVNPVTNKIYVTNYVSNNVTVIDGANNNTAFVNMGTEPFFLAVNPVTNKIYVVNRGSNNVAVIDGATNNTTSVNVGSDPVDVAVNPVTNKIYVVNGGSNNVTVIDGATNNTTFVNAGFSPWAVAVNPVTNKIYVTNLYSNTVTVLDGATNNTNNVNVGTNPSAVSVNPVTNKIYVVNRGGGSVTVIDGVTNNTTNVTVGTLPQAVAVNPVTNKIYVANTTNNNVTVIDGESNNTTTVNVGSSPDAVAVNPVTNKIYVTNSGSNNVTVIDGATNNTTFVNAGNFPHLVTVNPVTNKIYVENFASDNVTVIDGTTNNTTTVGTGEEPYGMDVNLVTNMIYVANLMSDNVTVIDGTTNNTTNVNAGSHPWAVAVDPLTNKIYVANRESNDVTVIDGATNSITTLTVGSGPFEVALNLLTNKIYVTNSGSGNVTVIDDVPVNDTKVQVKIDTLPNNVTCLARPIITGKGVNRSAPNRTRIEGVIQHLNTAQQPWSWTEITSGAGTDSVHWSYNWGSDSLIMGENLVCAIALESDAGTTNNHGLGTPFAGNLMVYPIYRIGKDVGVTRIVSPPATIDSGASVAPACSVYNYGPTVNYTVRMKIGSFYNQTATVNSHLPNTYQYVIFPAFNQWQRGSHAVSCSTELIGDWQPLNDRQTGSVLVNVHDVGSVQIIAPVGTIDSTMPISPLARVRNHGTYIETFDISFRIGSDYARTRAKTIDPGVEDTVTFPVWIPIRGTHTTRCSTYLANDANPINDTISNSVTVRVINAGVAAIIAPTGTIDSGSVVTPQVKVKNYGTNSASFPVWFKIHSTPGQLATIDKAPSNLRNVFLNPFLNQASTLKNLKTEPIANSLMRTTESGFDQVYEDSVWVSIVPGDSTICSFQSWTPTILDTYQLESYTLLDGDMVPENDSVHGSVIVRRPIHDVGVLSILAPHGAIDSGTVVIPKAVAKNFGAIPENFPIRFKIGDFYTDTTIITLGAGIIDTVEFTSWTAIQVGTHITKCTTLLASDTNHANDFIRDSVRVRRIVGIDESDYTPPLPKFFTLENNRPNPFGSQTIIRYALPKECNVSICIYNSAGVLVRTLKTRIEPSGYYQIIWDGKDNQGKPVSYGIYYCRMITNEFKAMKKLIKLK